MTISTMMTMTTMVAAGAAAGAALDSVTTRLEPLVCLFFLFYYANDSCTYELRFGTHIYKWRETSGAAREGDEGWK